MPRFLDHHPIAHASLTEEALEMLQKHIKDKQPDDFGVRWLNAFVAVNGEGYCLSEAPDADAVVRSHESIGYLIESLDVIEVTTVA